MSNSSDPAPAAPLAGDLIGRTLRHPWARRMKCALRDAWWRVKGAAISNPPLPAAGSVLFVCLGNICRSPFAEGIARRRAQELSLADIIWASAGLKANQAAAPPDEARAVAKSFGVSLDTHQPVQVTRALMAATDVVVAMEAGQAERLRNDYPDLAHRVFLLPLFDNTTGGFDRFHIEDPFSQPPAAYEACYRRIDRSIRKLVGDLAVARATMGTSREART